MKTLGILLLLVIIIGGIFWIGTRDNTPVPNGDSLPVETGEEVSGTSVPVDVANSRLTWTGRRNLIPGYVDSGIIPFKSGNVITIDGEVVGGEFIFNVAQIQTESTSNENGAIDRLTEHLHSDDFFNVEVYPEARFAVTKVEPRSDLVAENATHLVTGNLTLKDVTAPVSLPARIVRLEDGTITVLAMFDIDRTKWNIRYGSGSFFDNLGDSVIDDMVTLNVSLVTVAQ